MFVSIFWQLTVKQAQVLAFCLNCYRLLQNEQEDNYILATSEPYSPLCEKQRLRSCIL